MSIETGQDKTHHPWDCHAIRGDQEWFHAKAQRREEGSHRILCGFAPLREIVSYLNLARGTLVSASVRVIRGFLLSNPGRVTRARPTDLQIALPCRVAVRRINRIFVSLALLLLTARASAAEAPQIAVEAGAEEIFIGESVDYLIEIRNVKDPAPPDVSALRDDFDVAPNGDESRNQSSTLVVNGNITRREIISHVYRFRLTPKHTGNLVVKAPTATVDGTTITGRTLRLKVTAPEEQGLVIPEIAADRTKVYPTQPFEVVLRILVRPLPEAADRDPLTPLRRQPPHLEVNWVDVPAGLSADEKPRWLEKLLSENGTGFTLNDVTMRSGSIFDGPRAAVFHLYRGREKAKDFDGQTVNYFAYELKRTFTPETSGTYRFGPATVKGTFVDGVEGRNYSGRRIVAVAPAVQVEVREVPSPRPATFCGGIGQYTVSAAASPTTLRVGDPLTLTLAVERGKGSGSLDLVSAPDVSANPQVAADFEIIDKNPTGQTAGDVKRFAYAMRPRRAGVGIPPLSVTVFNPDNEEFTGIETDPIALSVSEASRLGAGDLVGSLATTGTSEIKSREQGIFQNITDPSQLADQRVDIVLLAEATAGMWCAVGCLIVVVTSYRRKSGDVGWQRRQQARGAANRKLAEARKAVADGRPEDALRSIRAAVVGYIADMQNRVAEGLTASEVDSILAATAVSVEERAGVVRLLEAIESAEYGSGKAAEAPAMIDSAAWFISSLARPLERG